MEYETEFLNEDREKIDDYEVAYDAKSCHAINTNGNEFSSSQPFTEYLTNLISENL